MTKTSLLCLFAVAAFGQMKITVPEPTNIDFSQGEERQMPPGWNMPQGVLEAGYRTELRKDDSWWRFDTCVAYIAPKFIGTARAPELQQTFPADPYSGKTVRSSAWLRLQEARDGGYIHIRMRVDYASEKVEMHDSVAAPVTSPMWQQREVLGFVGPGAVSITVWARYVPSGSGWVAQPSFGVVENAKTAAPATPVATGAPSTGSFPVTDAAGKTARFSGFIKTETVSDGYVYFWWRVDGATGKTLAFNNSPVARGPTNWTWYSIELPVAAEASNIISAWS